MPTYLDLKRIHKQLHAYSLPPNSKNPDGSWAWSKLTIGPKILHKETLFSGEIIRLVEGKYKNKNVVILQSHNPYSNSLWTNESVYSLDHERKILDKILPDPENGLYIPTAQIRIVKINNQISLRIQIAKTSRKELQFSCTFLRDGQPIFVSGLADTKQYPLEIEILSSKLRANKRPYITLKISIWKLESANIRDEELTLKTNDNEIAEIILPDSAVNAIANFMYREFRRLRDEVLQAILDKQILSTPTDAILGTMILEYDLQEKGMSIYESSPLSIAERYLLKEAAAEIHKEEWKQRRTDGIITIAVAQCPDCDKRQILGYLNPDKSVTPASKEFTNQLKKLERNSRTAKHPVYYLRKRYKFIITQNWEHDC